MSRTNTYLRQLPPDLTHIDVYWVLRLFNVTDPCAQHAVKKLLADGSGDKDRAENMREAWETLDRWREMESESTHKELRQHHPDGMTRWIEKRRLHEAMDPWLQPERQEQVRERHDIVQTALDARTTTDTPCCWTHAADSQRQLFIVCSVCGNKRCPRATDCALDCTGSNELGQAGSRFAWEPPDSSAQRPPDRPLASHCPDGGACRHKCGMEACKEGRA